MQNRRTFLKEAALAAAGSGLIMNNAMAENSEPFMINRHGKGGKMVMNFFGS